MSTASAIASQSSTSRRPSVCCNASCRHAAACEATRGGDPDLLDMREVVERVGPFSEGDRLVQPDAPHLAAFAVHSGLAKTVTEGRVVAFHLPGELFALDAQRTQTHSASVVAVGKTWFCRFPRTATDALCEHSAAIATHLRTLRRRERAFTRRATDGSALERVTSFLLELFDRRRRVEGIGSGFVPLPMSRDDIGSYLGMSAATVTRMLARLRSDGSIAIRADGVDVLHEASLRDRFL
ncbi:Crp/Fnr family transcriptional regulator [Luteibacter sp. dw_328]|uniref:Crp/Fnr family transcriptional regulator n=1 Tax=Luteibacter sp. dw_328 TaxID=2719796 RepID=UPI001BD5D350